MVEKKSVYHFLPGAPCLTVAVVGCNLDCPYCINARHAQRDPTLPVRNLLVAEIAARLRAIDGAILCISAAEPLVQAATLVPLLSMARCQGRETLILTNLLSVEETWRPLLPHLSALKVDLKADLPASWTVALDHARYAREAGCHVEVSSVVLPEEVVATQTYDRLFRQVVDHLGSETPCHLVRFFPEHRLAYLPPTPAAALVRLRERLLNCLPFVYLDQPVADAVQDTVCPGCGGVLVVRFGSRLLRAGFSGTACPACGRSIPGRFGLLGRAAASCGQIEEEVA